jgi:hypothetical protein
MSVNDDVSSPHQHMYEVPTKGDLDRNLSMVMHSAHHKARAECGRLKSEFAARGLVLSTALISAAVVSLNKIHSGSIDEAMHVIRDFVERMQVSPQQIAAWARPHLENLGNVVLGRLPPAGHPQEHQRIRAQYALVFQQRLDGALRDIEIGFIRGKSMQENRGQPSGRYVGRHYTRDSADHIKAATPLVKPIAIFAGVLAGLFVFAGISLVWLGATGDTEISLFGNSFKSQNVGIASMFCGAVLAATTFRRVLTSIERLGRLKD